MNYEEFRDEFVDVVKENLYERGNEVDMAVFAEAYESGVPSDEIVE